MKAASWQDCLEHFSARKVTPDFQRAQSLEKVAKLRIKLVKRVTPENCNFVFEDYYTSLLEVLEALAFRKGFNILNHVCIGFFLKEFLGRIDLFFIFEDLRYKRNSLTYYGNEMEFGDAKKAISRCKKLISEVLSKL